MIHFVPVPGALSHTIVLVVTFEVFQFLLVGEVAFLIFEVPFSKAVRRLMDRKDEVKILSPETCSGPAGFTKVGPATLVSWVIPFG